ncbi:succinate dehydrogenase/fumarate reductase flavoprotein subunit [Prauserella sediminis]|uniref:Succinate dehydrogenase/fumarate reductase flavoprotein subunit n=1 Tax=Prauserella sediminis TaxID=577680 RepID=A0A839XKU0_9PSEU|nr:FAD-dependent oxidoreductase [Prauserella sediminis]MBB3663197.1 succinate dehydrogenase/fumarate reductase flavoprotein subunit [Prauserella sediminis]
MAEFDVVVLGTGAAGLTAALSAADTGASVGLFEKSSLIGGTTCLSSGVAWLPDNRYAREAGVEDSRAEGVRYLESLSRGMIGERRAVRRRLHGHGPPRRRDRDRRVRMGRRPGARFSPRPMSYPATVPTNTGDGLRMAMKAGARLGNMREAWWVPVCVLPGQENHGEQAVHLVLRERTLPRSIMVNRAGERFTNEAANYNALGGAFHQLDPSDFDYLGDPCWLIFDARHVEEYGGFTLPPGQAPDWALRADTIGELARKIDVEPATLGRTVDRFNGMAADGVDADFARGVSAYDGFVGDKRYYPAAASTLGPLDEGPYYAVRLHISTLGTKGGPQTDVDGSVFTVDGDPIPGLFAAGNAMAGPTGMVYGGAGGTLGPALVFGYRAGRAAASGGKR